MIRTTAEIDLNVRVRGNQTFTGFEDIAGPVAMFLPVEVIEPESGLRGVGIISDIDQVRRLVYISVDWRTLH